MILQMFHGETNASAAGISFEEIGTWQMDV
jgi:hypothetical protein